jgi:N-acetylmuramoyl-L-alanine amidase
MRAQQRLWLAALLLGLIVAGCAAPQVSGPPLAPVPSAPRRVSRPASAGCDVVIDPGHGGSHPGARGARGAIEKRITLSIGQRLRRRLQEVGVRVMMTRTGDETVSLWRRSHLARASGAWAFVSIHANAHRNRSASGFEVFYLPAYRRLNPQVVLAGGSRDDPNHRLARLVSGQFSRQWPLKNRGIKQARFYVLHRSAIPAVLVETGFITNRRDEALLSDPLAQEEIARRLATAILAYGRQASR